MKTTILVSFLLWSSWTTAAVLNVEFKFTPFLGDPATADQVETVPGKARVFLNDVPVAEQDVDRREVPVLFDDREIGPAVWVPVESLGPAVRKGKNTLRIEFEPTDAKAPYKAQLRWAEVTDQRFEAPGKITNQSGEGAETREGRGKLSFQRDFNADFAVDRPWHHAAPVTSLSDEDKQKLAALVKDRAMAFKPKFEGVYRILGANPDVKLAELKKSRCLDKAYAAGVRLAAPAADDMEFVTTGNPEVVVRGRSGPLFAPDPKAFERIKGDEVQMCAGMALSMAYPPRLVVVRNSAGVWEVVY